MSRTSFYWAWGAVVFAVAVFLYVFGGMLMPFVAGLVLAYLFNPVVQWAEHTGVRRRYSALALVIGAVFVFFLAVALVVPLLVQEMATLAAAVPDVVARAKSFVSPYIPSGGMDDPGRVSQMIESYASSSLRAASDVLGNALIVGQAAVSFVTFIALMPVVAYFMMVEWPHIVQTVDQALPRKQAPMLRTLFAQIDTRISGFVRGQLMMCLILAVYYTVVLSIIGLDYAMFVGVMSGVLALIPFVGSAFAFAASVLIGGFQAGDAGWGVMVAAVVAVAVGQFVEGNFITPKIVGDRVGLHPLWIIFALMAGAHVMGLLGMMIAVPVAAVVAVLVAYGIEQYKASLMYRGENG
jgi:predicted PurR-regulated permease PerM